jgi:hypothetical protein
VARAAAQFNRAAIFLQQLQITHFHTSMRKKTMRRVVPRGRMMAVIIE